VSFRINNAAAVIKWFRVLTYIRYKIQKTDP
jgi:hypothetical protein